MFGNDLKKENSLITIMGDSSGKPYFLLAIDKIPDLNFVSPASGGTRCFALYRYDKSSNRTDNITDWGLAQFVEYYVALVQPITKQAIFHYVYAVLHDPIYREKLCVKLKT